MVPGQLLERREWDGEAVLFNDLTGATHLLSDIALWALDRLRAASLDAAALAQALAPMLEEDAAPDAAQPDAGLIADLAKLLDQLHKMHLIEPC